jgi:hypothetical protein
MNSSNIYIYICTAMIKRGMLERRPSLDLLDGLDLDFLTVGYGGGDLGMYIADMYTAQKRIIKNMGIDSCSHIYVYIYIAIYRW